MPEKRKSRKYARRDFLKEVAAGGAVASTLGASSLAGQGNRTASEIAGGGAAGKSSPPPQASVDYPRTFTGRNLKMIAFPLGGIGTGTVSLGGRGQLRDWEIFNRPDKGNELSYASPAIWAKVGNQEPMARVLESRLQPPYETTPSGLGSDNAPGLPRLAEATFTGAYPFVRIAFDDPKLPAEVRLEAFNPLVPLDVQASEWPIAILRYTVRNPNSAPARVGIAWSIENPVGKEGRQAAFRQVPGLAGLYMDNPFLASSHPLKGTFALSAVGAPEGSVSYLRGWKRAEWWNGVLTFWDDFSDDGALDSRAPAATPVSSLAVTQTIPARGEAAVTFLLAWHFPNRTPERCGWPAPEGVPNSTVVGNAYTTRFADAWDASRQAADQLAQLEARTRAFARAIESSTLPPAVLDAATSTLSTLRTNTCFRTADGEFHGFEGCNDHQGCCHGNCTHVWNYEQATAQLFPTLARSLRESEFLRNTDANGLMGFRSYLPDGKQIWQRAAADGQMGCLIKLYREWKLSGDTDWLRRLWPNAKRALEFAWIENGWDANRDGVAEGVQHNTYDVEFYGPNPLCGVYYLGALRAGEEMARVLGDQDSAAEYHRLFVNGSRWFDQNLFNGQYYIQKVEGRPADQIAAGTRVGMGAGDTLRPDYQMGDACLTDQLLGQMQAHVAGLGYLLTEANVRATLKSVYKYNYQPNLSEHADLQRTYALNDEGGVVVATYPLGKRPEIPFPYFGEIWTGLEYQLAASLAYEGMTAEALRVVESVRRRYDGERRNPWNEPECGHHYARALASWGCFLAWSGFRYSALDRELTLIPRTRRQQFQCFWSVPSGWGSYTHTLMPQAQRVEVHVAEGSITVARLAMNGLAKGQLNKVSARLGTEVLQANVVTEPARRVITLDREIAVTPGSALTVMLTA
ncbi:MAG: GH116 family glycosyl-hydrolase [Terriglobia bacterium]